MIKVFAEGRIAKDARVFEYGKRNDIKTGVSFGLICNRFYEDEDPTYIQCVIWNRDENLADYLTTGQQMIITGNLTRNEEGYYSITVEDLSFGQRARGNRSNRDRSRDNSSGIMSNENYDQEGPFGTYEGISEDDYYRTEPAGDVGDEGGLPF